MLNASDIKPVLMAQLAALQAEDSRLSNEQRRLPDTPKTQRTYDRLNAKIMRNKGKMNALVWVLEMLRSEQLTDLAAYYP